MKARLYGKEEFEKEIEKYKRTNEHLQKKI
jgi:hypothetical protein